jgi:putative flippase GtrA
MKIKTNVRSELIRFFIAGSVITATDFSIYYVLFHFFSYSVAKGISFTSAGIVGYLLSKFWIFKNDRLSFSEAIRYGFINLTALGINVSVNYYILSQRTGAVLAALIITTSLTALFTFVSFKWWVFRANWKDENYFKWWRWFPWRALVSNAALKQGFLDPIKLLSQLQNFAQPSEVAAPTELLRSGVVLHARGLINSLAIQHNLDWVWPYWVECQYDPNNDAFIPRSFSLTQINLTHRNWTALGIPGGSEFPIVDPRGLVTPFYDSWSMDVWIIPEEGLPLIPSRLPDVKQRMLIEGNLCVITGSDFGQLKLSSIAQVIGSVQEPICQIRLIGSAGDRSRLVICLRPYNPEGVSFINKIELLKDKAGWLVNGESQVLFNKPPDKYVFSEYQRGDVFSRLLSEEKENGISCKVGMATSAAIYKLEAGQPLEITVSMPLTKNDKEILEDSSAAAQSAWKKELQGVCELHIPDELFQSLYQTAIHTMILHSPKEVYPGPFIYRRFWFRDAAFILNALLCVGLKQRVKRAVDCFRGRQTVQGYFLSQEGEWDSNGEALWIMRQYCEMTGDLPPEEWKDSIKRGGHWICHKLLPCEPLSAHAGLLPSGFSAEHLGPNDFYYWDDFWAVAGLKAAAYLSTAYKEQQEADYFESRSSSLLGNIDQSLKKVAERLIRPAIPASPYRRMDTGAIGSLAASYPLRIFEPDDPRVLDTAVFLMKNCLVHGGFFHNMTHSGINPYLTLHLAQVLLRAGDPKYFSLMTAVAKLASPTGQWPESIHPLTGGGCMGDGQHVWAAAEWVLMIRNCFVREENGGLILCSGIPQVWLDKQQTISFGPAPTSFGQIHISLKPYEKDILVEWQGQWFKKEPVIDICLPGFKKVRITPATNSFELKVEDRNARSSYAAV